MGGKRTPKIGKISFCKMGVSKKGGCLIFFTILKIPDWRHYDETSSNRHNKILYITPRTGTKRAMPQSKIVRGFIPSPPKLVCFRP